MQARGAPAGARSRAAPPLAALEGHWGRQGGGPVGGFRVPVWTLRGCLRERGVCDVLGAEPEIWAGLQPLYPQNRWEVRQQRAELLACVQKRGSPWLPLAIQRSCLCSPALLLGPLFPGDTCTGVWGGVSCQRRAGAGLGFLVSLGSGVPAPSNPQCLGLLILLLVT